MEHIERLKELGACREGIEWAATQPDMDAVWAYCPRGDWLLWLAARVGVDRKAIVLASCEIARDVLPIFEARHPTDKRPRMAIETEEAWARGEAAIGEVIAAAAAAAAADAAYAAAYAADAAAYAAYVAASARARTKALACYADVVRKHIPTITAAAVEGER